MQKDTEEIKKEIELLEAEMATADFWSDKAKAQATIRHLNELKDELEGSEKYDKGNAILSIVSGAGGDDAEDFSAILLRMYYKYIESRGWQAGLIHENKNDVGGYRNVSIEVIGKNVYGTLKNESGVHRLVRISPFNAKSLRHTSFSLVEVIPKFENLPAGRQGNNNAIEIPPEDMKIEFSKSGGPGGQNVNKRETAVRIVHIPTNLSAHVTTERSQEQNREKAIEILKGKLFKKRAEDQARIQAGLTPSKTTEIEWGSQIRSYVLHPYKQIKDHRTGVEVHDVDSVLESGELEPFIEAERSL